MGKSFILKFNERYLSFNNGKKQELVKNNKEVCNRFLITLDLGKKIRLPLET
jgi:hypothetical protein